MCCIILNEIRRKMFSLAEEDYRRFSEKLIPHTDRIMGVRVPALRKIARGITKAGCREYLNAAKKEITEHSFHEEIMLLGFVIGYADMEQSERKEYLDAFIPKIKNWAICDSCVSSFHFIKQDRQYWFGYLKNFSKSTQEFEIRFMIVALMYYFLDNEFADEVLGIYSTVSHQGYYAKMGNAWAMSVCYSLFPCKVKRILASNVLDDFTHNMTIRKIRESRRGCEEEKRKLQMRKGGTHRDPCRSE